MKKYDVFVVGASTTGCWFAYKMAKQGFKVLVIEKNVPDDVSREYDVFHMGKEDMEKFQETFKSLLNNERIYNEVKVFLKEQIKVCFIKYFTFLSNLL